MLSTKLKEAAGNSADATLYVDDVFSTWLYTGTGATQTITNGIDLAGKGGLVWGASRTGTGFGNNLFTTDVGVGSYLSTNGISEVSTSNGVTSFNSNGFTLGANSLNQSGNTFVSWTFRKAAKFFDVVTYTGTGSARTIAHSLGVAPGMVIVKRTDVASNWQVYHRSLTSAAYSTQLNLTDAQASAPTVWDSTAPTSSVFSVGTDATVNASGGTYVAYLYAHDTSSTGIIQCGSYTGNGSASGPVVTLGWEPQYLMIKVSSGTTGGWILIDSMRGMPVGSADAILNANSGALESSAERVSPTATGFQITSTSGQINTSGATYIYIAIRRGPMKVPTDGTKVFYPNARTGTSATATISGIGFTPDLYMVRARNIANDTYVADRLRGASKSLITSYAFDEVNVATSIVNSFNMNGVTIPVAGAANNTSPNTYIDYFFERAPEFFDEVCYTGTGVATTQAHNLTVVPELMIVKERSAINNWWVYDAIDGNTKYSVLNSTATPNTSPTAWNNTTPTASVFSIGTATNVNASAQTYVAYLFATLAGISKVGSYTGNGTGQAIACGFGSGGARFVLIKCTDSTGDWYTFDSARGLTVGSSPYLLLNSAVAEVTGNNGVYASTGGFTLGATAITTTNIAAATYIFLAIA
jgi:hypothetical protein